MKKRVRRLSPVIILVVLLMPCGATHGQSNEGRPGILRNPLNRNNGADPWLTYYEGNYYLAATTWASGLTMRKSPTLAGLKTAEPVQIYFETDPSRCCNMWAPEFRLLNGPDGLRWYFYYTAGTWGTYDNQHSHVLESAGTDPLGPYTYKATLHAPWSIDGSVLELNGSLYFLSSAFESRFQSLFIAPMSNPWTVSGERRLLSRPEYDWETSGSYVNEGPVPLYHDGKTFVIYSASACWTPDYKLGMLIYKGGDPLSRDSWTKYPEPVFQRSDENGVFAPGHNGFFKSPDGTEDWIVYHANDSVNDGCDGGRTTRVQKFTWNADGTPDFGVPVSTSEEIAAPSGDTGVDPLPEFPPQVISRFRSYDHEDGYLRHANFALRIDTEITPLTDSQFVVVPGLADPEAISIESVNFPGFFVRQDRNAILLTPDDGTESYPADATWWVRPGRADGGWISFESYSQPGKYISQMMGVVALVEMTDSTPDRAREDATFLEEREAGK
jgi:GH43 family beta-xylosidase